MLRVMNSAEQLLFQAATILEEEGDVEAAIDAIEQAIEICRIAEHPLALIRAHTMMGELLAQASAADIAADQFREVVRLSESYAGPASDIDEELAAARGWLAEFATSDRENH